MVQIPLIEINKKTKKKVDVVNPFKSKNFSILWKFYKEYLIESHYLRIEGTKEEQDYLNHLFDLSKGDDDKAIRMLETYIVLGEKTIIELKNEQIYESVFFNEDR